MTLHHDASHALTRRLLTRRAALRLIGTGLGVGLLAACAPAQAPAPAPAKPTEAPKPAAPAPTAAPAAPAATSAPAAAAPAKPAEGKPEAKTVDTKPEAKPGANQPKSGGVLRAGLNGDITSIWPNFGGTSSLEVNAGMFDRLLTYDKNLQVVPGLVESWDQSSDLKQVKLNIRKNVTFHNGRELTSDDVVYTLQRATDPTKTSPLTLVGLAKVWELSAPDKYTVIMKSDQPRISAFDLLTQLTVGDKGTLEGPDGKTKGMGTGPFVFQDWIQGDKIVYTKNKNYWQSGKPYLDGYQFTFYRDAQAMMTTLEAGSLDFVSYPQISDALRLRNDPKYAVQGIWDAGNAFAIWVTCTNAPFTDKKVRQAFAWAMDRKRIAETTLGGLAGPPRNLPWATYSPAYEPAKENTYGFDLDKAKSMLNAAGITSLDTVVNYASNSGPVPEFAQMAQIFQSDLSKIGVNLRIEPMDNATWVDAATKAAYKGFGIGMPGNFGAQDATAGLATGAFGQANSFTGFKSETYTQLYNEASVEPDPAKRKALYSKINDLILDECFTMTLTSFLQTSATSAKVHNTGRHPVGGGLILAEAWMD